MNREPEPTGSTALSRADVVTVYGIDACDDTTRALRHMAAMGLPHVYVNLDQDTAAKASVTDAGYHATPVVVTPDGSVFVEPSDDVLAGIAASIGAATIGRAG